MSGARLKECLYESYVKFKYPLWIYYYPDTRLIVLESTLVFKDGTVNTVDEEFPMNTELQDEDKDTVEKIEKFMRNSSFKVFKTLEKWIDCIENKYS